MHQDEVLDYDGRALGTYVGGGRWMVGLWREVFGGGYLPYASGMVAGVLVSAALVLQTRLLGVRGVLCKAVYGCMYLGCIQFAWMLRYSHQADAVALGFLFSTWAVVFLTGRKARYAAALFCAVAALAVYQTNILYITVLYLAWLLGGRAEAFPWRRVVACAVCMVLALVLWKLSVYVSWRLPWVGEGQIDFQTRYQDSLNQWGRLAELDFVEKAGYFAYYILVAARNLIGLAYKGQWVYATTLLPVVCLAVCSARGVSWRTACLRIGLLGGIWFSPFLFPVIMGTDQGPRTNLAEPLSCAILWVMFVARCAPRAGKVARWALAVFLVFVVFKGSVEVSVRARDEARDFQDGVADLRAMEICGLMVGRQAGVPVERILLCGSVPEVEDPETALQAKAHCLHSGTTTWYLAYLRSPFLKVAEQEDVARHREALDNMPAWPAAGSVQVDAGEVIIRVEPSDTHPVPSETVREREGYMRRFRQ